MADAMRPAPINAILDTGRDGVNKMFGDSYGSATGSIFQDEIAPERPQRVPGHRQTHADSYRVSRAFA